MTLAPIPRLRNLTTGEHVQSLREQLEQLTLTQVDEALVQCRQAAALLAEVAQGAAPEGLRQRAALLAAHVKREADGLQSVRERL